MGVCTLVPHLKMCRHQAERVENPKQGKSPHLVLHLIKAQTGSTHKRTLLYVFKDSGIMWKHVVIIFKDGQTSRSLKQLRDKCADVKQWMAAYTSTILLERLWKRKEITSYSVKG